VVDLPYGLKLFADWLPKNVLVWGNGASFDNAILAQCYRAVGMDFPWKFWNDRCYRTLKNLVLDVPFERTGTHHNALDDARSQAIHASAILRRMGEAFMGGANV
jgi:exodeoxyribonuclease VIII